MTGAAYALANDVFLGLASLLGRSWRLHAKFSVGVGVCSFAVQKYVTAFVQSLFNSACRTAAPVAHLIEHLARHAEVISGGVFPVACGSFLLLG